MTHVFEIEPLGRFEGAAIRRPREIACFSYDEEHKFRLDSSSLRYYYPPSLPADLSRGFDTFRSLDDTSDDHLDGLLTALTAYERGKGAKVDAEIITWRGMATKLMTVPFSRLDEWEMNCTLFQGSLFIEENHAKKLESKQQQHAGGGNRNTRGKSQDMMSYWGYKFETLSLLDDHWSRVSREHIEGRGDKEVSNYAQYCSIVRTGFGKLKLVLAGEVDAVMDYKPEDAYKTPVNWVELKTTAEVRGERDWVKLERKLLKFWAQSFLLGVPTVIVGYRDEDGVLKKLEKMDTQAIPELVRTKGKGMWNGDVCVAFMSAFLAWLRGTVVDEGVWRIKKRTNAEALEVWKVEETGFGDILHTDFVDWRLNELPLVKKQAGDEAVANGSVAGGEVQEQVDTAGLQDAKAKLLKSLQQNGDDRPP